MVEKIDRPETKPIYKIREAKQTKENLHQQQNGRENAEKEYKKQLEGNQKEWKKFGRRSMVIKPVHASCDRISRIVFKGINLYKGIGILHVDIVWKDGRRTNGALLRANMDEYLRLRRIPIGKDIPSDFWHRGETLEIGILQSMGSSGPFPIHTYGNGDTENEPSDKSDASSFIKFLAKLGLVDSATKRPNWTIIIFVTSIITVTALAFYLKDN